MTLHRMRNGSVRKYAFPGGYPLFYIHECTALCPECADELADEEEIDDEDFESEANWENPHLYCDGCGERIESAYAEDDEDDED